MSWWPSNFQELAASAERLAEQSAVSLGILSPEDVGEQLPAHELAAFYVAEACSLKDTGKGSVLLGCGSPKVVDGQVVAAGPTTAAIEATLHRWLLRLSAEGKAGANAADALLQSLAINILIKEMVGSRDGREVIRAAAQSPTTPLRQVLRVASVVPEALLEQLLRLMADVAHTAATTTRERGGQKDDSAKQALQWVLTLLSAAMCDPGEAIMNQEGYAVLAVHRAKERMASLASAPECTEAMASESNWEKRLDAVQTLGFSFMELKGICEELDPKRIEKERAKAEALKKKKERRGSKKDAKSNARATTDPGEGAVAHLSALVGVLSRLREENSSRQVTMEARAAYAEIGALSLELEGLVAKRLANVELIKRELPGIQDSRESIATLCLQCEEARRNEFEAVLSSLEKTLWGADAYYLQEDKDRLHTIGALVARAGGIVVAVWREMVSVAAECLDNDNPIGASSEDMSKVASRYKAMQAEIQGLMSRTKKLEAGVVEKPIAPKAAPPQAAQPAASSSSSSSSRPSAVVAAAPKLVAARPAAAMMTPKPEPVPAQPVATAESSGSSSAKASPAVGSKPVSEGAHVTQSGSASSAKASAPVVAATQVESVVAYATDSVATSSSAQATPAVAAATKVQPVVAYTVESVASPSPAETTSSIAAAAKGEPGTADATEAVTASSSAGEAPGVAVAPQADLPGADARESVETVACTAAPLSSPPESLAAATDASGTDAQPAGDPLRKFPEGDSQSLDAKLPDDPVAVNTNDAPASSTVRVADQAGDGTSASSCDASKLHVASSLLEASASGTLQQAVAAECGAEPAEEAGDGTSASSCHASKLHVASSLMEASANGKLQQAVAAAFGAEPAEEADDRKSASLCQESTLHQPSSLLEATTSGKLQQAVAAAFGAQAAEEESQPHISSLLDASTSGKLKQAVAAAFGDVPTEEADDGKSASLCQESRIHVASSLLEAAASGELQQAVDAALGAEAGEEASKAEEGPMPTSPAT